MDIKTLRRGQRALTLAAVATFLGAGLWIALDVRMLDTPAFYQLWLPITVTGALAGFAGPTALRLLTPAPVEDVSRIRAFLAMRGETLVSSRKLLFGPMGAGEFRRRWCRYSVRSAAHGRDAVHRIALSEHPVTEQENLSERAGDTWTPRVV